ncbi:hypothetical protein EDB83DRAFT_2487393 [Lactarius deliciosus]|nr:hypothetical protein EDB83DRAFT_2487393 [Lactarius deliciosus]
MGALPRGCPFASPLRVNPRGVSAPPPVRVALARERWGRYRVAARSRSPLRANPRGVSAPPPVRVALAREPGRGATERAPSSLALVSDAQGRGRHFCALPPRANPGRCSRLERAPRSRTARACKRRRGAKGVGGAPALIPARAPRLRVASARKPGEGGKGGAHAFPHAVPRRVSCSRVNEGAGRDPAPCRTSLLRLPSLARKRERRWRGLVPRAYSSRVNKGGTRGGTCRAPIARERGARPFLHSPRSRVNRGGGGGGVRVSCST